VDNAINMYDVNFKRRIFYEVATEFLANNADKFLCVSRERWTGTQNSKHAFIKDV
jgi:hypothetical protein